LVFRHTKLKLLTKASISCLSHASMSITTRYMSVFAIACMQKITHFFIIHRAISENHNISDMKICSFSYLPWYFKSTKYEKIRDSRVFSLLHLTCNDPYVTSRQTRGECNGFILQFHLRKQKKKQKTSSFKYAA